jgi:phage terminase large subunit-like protein
MINSPPKRRGPGRPFKPGQSGNPGGKIRNLGVRRALMDMRLQAREYGPEALAKLVQLMRGVVTVGRKRVIVPVHTQGWAAAEIIDRGWGRAPQGLEVTGANGGPIEIEGARLANMSSAELLALESASSLMPAGDWFVWMIMTGRGWGKTRTATENISRMIRGPSPLIAPPGASALVSCVADTAFDMRQYSVEGPSGFLNVGHPDYRPRYRGAPINTLTWPNGCKALLFSAEDPEVTRGASGSFFWWDELAKARRAEDGWTNMLFGMREGNPRGIVTTTPRPIPLIKRLIKAASTHVTVGSTWSNRANLSPIYYKEVIEPLIGTRTGRQEINAEIIEVLPGALWTRTMIDDARCRVKLPDMQRVVVAVDPSGARDMSERANSHIGIVVAGRGVDGRGYVLADRSCKLPPGQ